jgi:hypothetical protein
LPGYTLGINAAYHDSAACLGRDGGAGLAAHLANPAMPDVLLATARRLLPSAG